MCTKRFPSLLSYSLSSLSLTRPSHPIIDCESQISCQTLSCLKQHIRRTLAWKLLTEWPIESMKCVRLHESGHTGCSKSVKFTFVVYRASPDRWGRGEIWRCEFKVGLSNLQCQPDNRRVLKYSAQQHFVSVCVLCRQEWYERISISRVMSSIG